MASATTLSKPETIEEGTPGAEAIASHRLLTTVFVVAAFLGSTLLFLVQPLVARLILPLAGGSAALWNTAMVFFQVALLLGYGFAHLSVRRLTVRRHPILQTAVIMLPLAVLPLGIPNGWSLPSDVAPAAWVLLILTVMVGLPFFALATTSPTLQMWLSSTSHPRAADPYFLYAAGNVGSVLALVGYPLVLEPLFSLTAQSRIWAMGYVAFVAACIAAGVLTRRYAVESDTDHDKAAAPTSPIPMKQKGRWLFWAFVPSALMLGVTLHISTDLASFPLLWIIPLLLYLVTFIIAFGKDSATRTTNTANLVWFGAILLAATAYLQRFLGIYVLVIHLAWFFVAALMCHAKLAADRPATNHLTSFYFILSLGGALGGIFASLVAPLIFALVLEYPIAIGLSLVITGKLQKRSISDGAMKFVYLGLAALLLGLIVAPAHLLWLMIALGALLFVSHGSTGATLAVIVLLTIPTASYLNNDVVLQDRSFFGVYKIVDETDGTRELVSGTTVHGTQLLDWDGVPPATTYYFDEGPVGQVFDIVQPTRVGVVGLGAGTLATYGSAGDTYTFWEIDQLVVDIAEDPQYFNYLSTTEADVEILVEDGRHGLATSDAQFDLLVIDAFGSDAIPVHLLTAEAIQVYLDRLAPGGTLLMHISNRHFNLRPVVAGAATAASAQAWVQDYSPSEDAIDRGAVQSSWVVVSPNGEPRGWMDSGRFTPIEGDQTLWTDDYSNVLGTLSFD